MRVIFVLVCRKCKKIAISRGVGNLSTFYCETCGTEAKLSAAVGGAARFHHFVRSDCWWFGAFGRVFLCRTKFVYCYSQYSSAFAIARRYYGGVERIVLNHSETRTAGPLW